MRRKYNFLVVLIIFFLPFIHLFDNQIIASNNLLPQVEESFDMVPLADEFKLGLHIGDPFGTPYHNFEFNPDDTVLITGIVKNIGYGGSPTIKVAIWLVHASSSAIQTHIINLTESAFAVGQERTLQEMNGGNEVNWSINNYDAGTYRVMAQVYVNNVLNTQTVSGKAIVVRQLRLVDFYINSTKKDTWMEFWYNLTNSGNCDINGVMDIKIESLILDQAAGWQYTAEVTNSTYADGVQIAIQKGDSLVGTARWYYPFTPQAPLMGTYRLYIGILDAQNNLLHNLNNSVPFQHPTQGGLYINSDKLPRLKAHRTIQQPSKYYDPEELNVTLHLEVVGMPPEEIGVFNFSDILTGISNINLQEELLDEVFPTFQPWYSIDDGGKITLPPAAIAGNTFRFNSSWILDPRFQAMSVGTQMKFTYGIQVNFTPIINQGLMDQVPALEYLMSKNVGIRDDLILAKGNYYDSVVPAYTVEDILPPNHIAHDIVGGKVGIAVYIGRLFDLYDNYEALSLIINLIAWGINLPSLYHAELYLLDDDLGDHLDFMGLSNTQKGEYNSRGLEAKADYLFTNVESNLIAKAIEECVTAEAQEEGWDYLMLVGGVEVIPMRLEEHPKVSSQDVGTDFFYGDLTPEADLERDGWMPEIIVSRLAGRNPTDMITLLNAGDVNNATSGRAGLITYYKGEYSMRRLADNWDAVKEPGDVLYHSEGEYIQETVKNFLNPGSTNYGGDPANFPYAFILFSDHAGYDALGDNELVLIEQSDLASFDDYVDNHHPFYFLRACQSGWIGDQGKFTYGQIHPPEESICLDLLAKGAAGVLGSTRSSYSPVPTKTDHYLDLNDTQPPGAPASLTGRYRFGQVTIEGAEYDAFMCRQPDEDNWYTWGFDENQNHYFEPNEIYDDEEETYLYLQSPSNPYLIYRIKKCSVWICVWDNSPEDWNDIFAQYFMGEIGTGIMDGANVGTAFYNAKRMYWGYMQSGVHHHSYDIDTDYLTILEYNLYGVPIYKPNLFDPPGLKNYTVQFSPVNDLGFNATFEIQNYTHSLMGEYDLFEIPGTVLTHGQDIPRLPMIMENISIPAGFQIADIQMIANESSVLPGTYNISRSGNASIDAISGWSNAKLQTATSYPGKFFDYSTVKERDGSTTVFLYVFPFQWDSTTEKVTYYNLTLDVDITDALEESASLAVTKTSTFKKIGRGSNFLISLEIVNNGSNSVYDLQLVESVGDEIQGSKMFTSLSPFGFNRTLLTGFYVHSSSPYFSGWFSTTTTILFQDGAGTTYSMTVTLDIWLETWLGIAIIILCLIAALAITIAILWARK